MGTLRGTAAWLAAVTLCACGAAGGAPDDRDAPIEPVIVEPRVPVEAVGDRLGAVQTSNASRILEYLEAAAQPGQLSAADRASIAQEDGDARCWSLPLRDANKIAYVRRRNRHWWAATLPMGEGERPVPPLTWMGATVTINRAEEGALEDWYRELSRRVATTGRASGIVLDDDGNATGVVVELRVEPEQGDAELVARALRMRPAQFDAAAWGPALPHTWGASSMSINGRAGVSVCDLLSLRPF